ncbi:MAG: hypothetical protein WD401_05255 [Thermomicrobiaceae bacterium]
MNDNPTHPMCLTDGFPLIELDGAIVCSVEHADEHIGGQPVTDARIRDGYLHLIFGNGASLPLTCPCCAGRLHLRNMPLESLSQMLSGRSIEGFRHGEWVSNESPPERHPIFALQFTGQEDLSARTIQVNLESVRRIIQHSPNTETRLK